MKRIFYSLPGEGLGHAARTKAIIDRLEHEVHIFTWGEAFDFFKKQNYPYLHKIAGIPFGRDSKNKIQIFKTIKNFISFLFKYRKSFKEILEFYEEIQPDLFVVDFEPILPRVARKIKAKYLSIDNQHKFSHCKIDDLPTNLRFFAYWMGMYTEINVPDPTEIIISTFYHSAVKKTGNVTLVNCFMRKEFDKYKSIAGDYILVYYKNSCGPKILEILNELDISNVKVYNCPEQNRKYGFEYHDTSNESFIAALAGCQAIFCGSGNQLLGESAFYGKPIFTIPEPNQPEQLINAYYVDKMGYGAYSELENISTEKVVDFLNTFKQRQCTEANGVDRAVEIINQYLNEKSTER